MKKFIYSAFAFVLVAGMALTTVSCGNSGKSGSAKLESDVDSLGYAMGLSYTNGLNDYLKSLGVDSTMTDQFIKGLEDAVKGADDKKMVAYNTGISIGSNLKQQLESMNRRLAGKDSVQVITMDKFLAGFIAGVKEDTSVMTLEQTMEIQNVLGPKIQERETAKANESAIKAGKDWLAKNAKKEGVKTFPSGLQYKVITEGKGEKPTMENTVKVNYEGKLTDGTVFDSSYERGEAVDMPLASVVPGFSEAITNMPVGSKWEVYIPQELGYGSRAAGQIPAYSTLIFTIEVLEIVK